MAQKLEHEARQLIGKNWSKGAGTNAKLLSNIRSIGRFMQSQSLQSIAHMKTKHVLRYFDHLKSSGLQASTLQNHATAMRVLAAAIGKQNIVARTNEELGIIRHGRYSPKIADMAKHEDIREKRLFFMQGFPPASRLICQSPTNCAVCACGVNVMIMKW